jgi:hypothetical protein
LLRRPGTFYDRMATRGGLHEPVTFFLVTLGAGIVVSFLAALVYSGLVAPGAGAVSSQQYFRLTLPPKATGLALGLLPEILLGSAGLLVVAGSLFHLGARLFGAREREGSVSIMFYAASAALLPLVAALAVVFVVCGAAWLVQAFASGPSSWAPALGRWTGGVLAGVGVLAGGVLFVWHCILGCARVSQLDGVLATAAALCGLLLALVVPAAATVAYFVSDGSTAALVFAIGGSVAVGVAVCQGIFARKERYPGLGGPRG